VTLETSTLAVLAQVEALAPSATAKEVVYLAKAVEAARAEDPAGIDVSAARTALLARIKALAPNADANDIVYLGKAQEAVASDHHAGGHHMVVDHLVTTGNAAIGGDLMVNGDTVTVDAQTVQVADNVMVLNHGEAGAGVTAGEAGLAVDRGTEAAYRLVFRESDDTFVIGETGSEQAVATRQDAPPANAVPVWDAAAHQYVGTGLTWEGGVLRYPAALYAVAQATVGATHTLDLAAGEYQALTLTDNTVITLPEPPAGRGYSVTLKLIQDATGGHTPTFQQANAAARWLGGGAPAWQTAPSTANLVVLTHDGTDLFAAHAGRIT